MRCRVGRKPTSRSLALTSCQGQPVRSPRSGTSSGFVAAAGLKGKELDWDIAASGGGQAAKSLQVKLLYATLRRLQLPPPRAPEPDCPLRCVICGDAPLPHGPNMLVVKT